MPDAEIATRRLHAQGIARPHAATALEVVTALGALQAQDHPGALWSIGLRMPGATRGDVEREIAGRAIVRTWPMRGTLHWVPAADARWMLDLLAPRIITGSAGRARELGLDDDTFRRARRVITRALGEHGILSRKSLFAALEAGGVSPAGQRGPHVLTRLCMEGLLCHGPHLGKEPAFVLFDEWLPGARTMERDEALATIARRYFTGHGPASLRDFAGWTGLPLGDARHALAAAMPALRGIVRDGVELYMGRNAGDVDITEAGDGAHLLPGFDEFMLGYKDRGAALAPRYADRICPGGNGMFISTLVLHGQVRGTWSRDTRARSVGIVATPFQRMAAADRRRFEAAAGRYGEFVGLPASITWAPA